MPERSEKPKPESPEEQRVRVALQRAESLAESLADTIKELVSILAADEAANREPAASGGRK